MSIDVTDPESAQLAPDAAAETAAALPAYRSLSAAAMATFILGILSSLALLDWTMGLVPAIALVLGVYAVRKVRRHESELTGLGLARAGLALAIVFWAVGATRLAYIYATEVPEGYERLSYDVLQPDPAVPGELVPPSAVEWHGKRVFVKGYVYPGRQTDGIQDFILCRDQGDCCFGGNPRLTDRIQVHLAGSLRLTYTPRPIKLAGTFRLQRIAALDGLGQVVYHLDADHLE